MKLPKLDLKQSLFQLGDEHLSKILGQDRLSTLSRLTNKPINLKMMIDLIYKRFGDQIFSNAKLRGNIIYSLRDDYKSYVYNEDFSFGFDLIIKDVSQLCSLKIEEVENFMKDIDLKNIIETEEESYLEKKYFYISPYRKIKHQLIFDIITARVEELFEICYQKNSNIKNLKTIDKIYIYVGSPDYYRNIEYVLEKSKLATVECIFNNNLEKSFLAGVNGACELIGKGWEKEAIPVVHRNKSFISGFFSRLFG